MKKRAKILSLILSACLCLSASVPAFTVSAAPDNTVSELLADNGLPVVYINIDETAEGYSTIEEMNSSPDHSAECTGTIQIDVPEGYKGDYSGEILTDTDELQLEYIRGRGNTTWSNDKKPYKLKLDKKADLLGMGKNKHWVLLANALDESLLRNKLTYYMGEQLGLAYTPKSMPVDVVMNGEYLGSYFLCEQVRIDKSRVDIDELTPEDNDEPEITGGYLFSLHGVNETEENIFTTENGAAFAFQNPQFTDDETGTPEQKAYLSNYLQEAENAIFSGNASEYMDLQSAADYWWVQVFTQNYDAYFTDSTYLYKPRNDKIYWGPLWDFDLALGKTYTSTEGYNFRLMPWLDYLRENDPDYLNLLEERWTILDGIITDIVKDGGVLDKYASEIHNSWEDNIQLTTNPYMNIDDEIENLRNWMSERQTWINDNLDKLSIIHVNVTFMADDTVVEQRTVNAGIPFSQVLPKAPEKDGFTFVGWEYNGELLSGENDMPYFWEDAVITAKYLDNSQAVMADNIWFRDYEYWVDINNYYYYPMYVITPDDAQVADVVWSSSDTETAEFSEYGMFILKKTGDVVLTATVNNDFSKSITLHIYDGNVTPAQMAASVTLESDTIRMKVGEYAQIVYRIYPQPCYELPMFDYDEYAGIISCISNNVFKALKPGTETVTVYINDDVQAVCTIIVTDEDEPSEESSEPSEEPSEESSEQSEEPSEETSEPTKEASEEPSEPSEESSEQSEEPSGETSEPTKEASEEPSEPSDKPSDKPAEPSEQPSAEISGQSETSTTTGADTVKTGDTSYTAVILAVLIISLVLSFVLIKRRKIIS